MSGPSAILDSLHFIQKLPSTCHWFCPRSGDDSSSLYFPEDLSLQGFPSASSVDYSIEIEQARSRREHVFQALQILAFGGDDAIKYQKWLNEKLTTQLRSCEICIREFYRGRRGLRQRLLDTYNDDDVQILLEKFDKLNRDRICEGLDTTTSQLEVLPPESRTLGKLDSFSIFAFFEALHCAQFYEDEALLERSFDKPFRLVQTNRMLKMSSLPPATTQFLFCSNKQRALWAEKTLTRQKRCLTRAEFEWTIKAALLGAMSRVQLSSLEQDFLPQFWKAVRIIVTKLDKTLITHELRALESSAFESDICMLALHHLQIHSDGFFDLLLTVRHLLETSPTDFWEAMGSIPPATWIDQFYTSPSFNTTVKQTEKEVGLEGAKKESIRLNDLFSWFIPFLRSVKPMTQPSVCRILVGPLLDKLQSLDYPSHTRAKSLEIGIEVVITTIQNVSCDKVAISNNITSNEAFELIARYSDKIMMRSNESSVLDALCLDFTRQALSLDCTRMTANRDALVTRDGANGAVHACQTELWAKVADKLQGNKVELARAALLSVWRLVGVEEFVTKLGTALPTKLAQYNQNFQQLNHVISEVLERINAFDPQSLHEFFESSEATRATVMLLVSSDSAVRSGAMEMMKTLSDKSTRSEAIDFMLRNHLLNVLGALSPAFRHISNRKTFQASHSLLRLSDNILSVLCDSQAGILRSQSLNSDNGAAVEAFWYALWRVLRMIFSTTETWSNVGHDKQQLMDFCRDTMEFAEKVIDQFGVISGALKDISKTDTESLESAGKRLIEPTRDAMESIVKWLKLRDEFLVSKSCALVCKLLTRLKEFDTAIDMGSTSFVESVIFGKVRTMLRQQQKAELQRALAIHVGHDIDQLAPHMQERTLKDARHAGIDIEKWRSNSQTASAKGTAEANPMAKLISAQSKSVEAFKASSMPKSKLAALKMKPLAASGSPDEFLKRRQKEKEEEKKRKDAVVLEARKRVANAGAGPVAALNGLGVQGKDHGSIAKGTGMMVSSDEEGSDESDEDLDKELFGGSKKATKLDNMQHLSAEEQARAMRRSRPTGPVKKQRLVRSAKDMRARLTPDLSLLHKQLLGWEYFHDGPFPPNTNAQAYASVLNTFRDASDYQRTFQPLLVLEAWNGFLKAREENTSRAVENKVISRSSVDSFVEISTTVSPESWKEVAEGDMVILSTFTSPGHAVNEPHHLCRISRVARKKHQVEVLYKTLPGTPFISHVSPGTSIFGLKIMSLIPLEREYGALLGLQYYDLCDEIAKAKPSPLLNYSDETLQSYLKNYNVNKAQAKAIRSALDNDAFTLIQGPPGSGKTKTIVAIVGALLSDSFKQNATLISKPQAGATTGQGTVAAKKLLVCAPSNAAVDELVMRFKDGIKTLNGSQQQASIVRLGRSDAINASVLDVTLDEMVNKKLNVSPVGDAIRDQTQKIMEQHKTVSERLNAARNRLNEAEKKQEPTKSLHEDFQALRREKAVLGSKIDNAKDSESAHTRQAEIDRRKAQQQIIDDAHIICATLSGSGHELFQNLNVEFETVVIDEAAQCVELSALIPLKYGCAKCILVGDPQQLPPTVFSKEAARFKYEQSLFVRMQANHPNDVHLLDTQYRMHPEISSFPSQAFYNGRLLDGPDMAKLRIQPWHSAELLGPYRFFDVQGQHQADPKGHSLINLAEVRIALQLYNRLQKDFKSYDFKGKIGIITPYKSQLRELKDQFRRQFGQDISDTIEFNTTDAFQGRESEIIIFSCVRASPSSGIGFLQDIRRMNVGLTRAKSSLWVLGNSQSLSKGEYWSKLLEHSRKSGKFTQGDIEKLLRNPLKYKHRPDQHSTHALKTQDPPVKDLSSGYKIPAQASANIHSDSKRASLTKVEASLPASSRAVVADSHDQPASSINRKRKYGSDEEMKSANASSSSTGSSSATSSSDDDIEMTDAPPESVANGDLSGHKVSHTNGVKKDQPYQADGINRTMKPAKRPPDVFLKKKSKR